MKSELALVHQQHEVVRSSAQQSAERHQSTLDAITAQASRASIANKAEMNSTCTTLQAQLSAETKRHEETLAALASAQGDLIVHEAAQAQLNARLQAELSFREIMEEQLRTCSEETQQMAEQQLLAVKIAVDDRHARELAEASSVADSAARAAAEKAHDASEDALSSMAIQLSARVSQHEETMAALSAAESAAAKAIALNARMKAELSTRVSEAHAVAEKASFLSCNALGAIEAQLHQQVLVMKEKLSNAERVAFAATQKADLMAADAEAYRFATAISADWERSGLTAAADALKQTRHAASLEEESEVAQLRSFFLKAKKAKAEADVADDEGVGPFTLVNQSKHFEACKERQPFLCLTRMMSVECRRRQEVS